MKYTNKSFSVPFSYTSSHYYRTFPYRAIGHIFVDQEDYKEAVVVAYHEKDDKFVFVLLGEDDKSKHEETVDEFLEKYA